MLASAISEMAVSWTGDEAVCPDAVSLEEDLTYTPNQLDRDVVAEDQIRTVIQTFRDRLFTQHSPTAGTCPRLSSLPRMTATPMTLCA